MDGLEFMLGGGGSKRGGGHVGCVWTETVGIGGDGLGSMAELDLGRGGAAERRGSTEVLGLGVDAMAAAVAAPAMGILFRDALKDALAVEARAKGRSERSSSRGPFTSLGKVVLRVLEELECGSEREL